MAKAYTWSSEKHLIKIDLPVDYISAHGTATPYNDEMESIAISRAGLQDVPVNSFKGYWGHTLGAAGVIEIIAGACSLSENLLFGTLGYSEPGTTHPLAVIRETREARLNTCLKIASGFGGCNAALLIQQMMKEEYVITDYCIIRNKRVWLNGNLVFEGMRRILLLFSPQFTGILISIMPKFFKMDNLCKLGFLASEFLLRRQELHSGLSG